MHSIFTRLLILLTICYGCGRMDHQLDNVLSDGSTQTTSIGCHTLLGFPVFCLINNNVVRHVEVEKIVETVVETIVVEEKRVEVPIEKIVRTVVYLTEMEDEQEIVDIVETVIDEIDDYIPPEGFREVPIEEVVEEVIEVVEQTPPDPVAVGSPPIGNTPPVVEQTPPNSIGNNPPVVKQTLSDAIGDNLPVVQQTPPNAIGDDNSPIVVRQPPNSIGDNPVIQPLSNPTANSQPAANSQPTARAASSGGKWCLVEYYEHGEMNETGTASSVHTKDIDALLREDEANGDKMMMRKSTNCSYATDTAALAAQDKLHGFID